MNEKRREQIATAISNRELNIDELLLDVQKIKLEEK